jgi:hypothetical protein
VYKIISVKASKANGLQTLKAEIQELMQQRVSSLSALTQLIVDKIERSYILQGVTSEAQSSSETNPEREQIIFQENFSLLRYTKNPGDRVVLSDYIDEQGGCHPVEDLIRGKKGKWGTVRRAVFSPNRKIQTKESLSKKIMKKMTNTPEFQNLLRIERDLQIALIRRAMAIFRDNGSLLMKEEGVFRESGSKLDIDPLIKSLENEGRSDLSSVDQIVLASAIKKMIKELALLPKEGYLMEGIPRVGMMEYSMMSKEKQAEKKNEIVAATRNNLTSFLVDIFRDCSDDDLQILHELLTFFKEVVREQIDKKNRLFIEDPEKYNIFLDESTMASVVISIFEEPISDEEVEQHSSAALYLGAITTELIRDPQLVHA